MAGEVTELLSLLSRGDEGVVDRLIPAVYQDLHALAAAYLRQERPGHTLQPTALVHEAYLRLVDQRAAGWKDRNHFFALASQAMRRALVDHARARGRLKRGAGAQRVRIDAALGLPGRAQEDVLELDDALTRLAQVEPLAARVVELRCFGGLSAGQAAEVLGTSESTVARQWRLARAWLHCELSGGGRDGGHDAQP